MASENRHPIPALLTVGHRLVPRRLDRQMGELVVDHLDLLQANEIGRAGREPVLEEGEASVQSVDVPGGDAHVRSGA